ncbi:MAG: hypothetical protein ACTSYD_08860 [Candidatus Heimdallarchaeaceae archaeon]
MDDSVENGDWVLAYLLRRRKVTPKLPYIVFKRGRTRPMEQICIPIGYCPKLEEFFEKNKELAVYMDKKKKRIRLKIPETEEEILNRREVHINKRENCYYITITPVASTLGLKNKQRLEYEISPDNRSVVLFPV